MAQRRASPAPDSYCTRTADESDGIEGMSHWKRSVCTNRSPQLRRNGRRCINARSFVTVSISSTPYTTSTVESPTKMPFATVPLSSCADGNYSRLATVGNTSVKSDGLWEAPGICPDEPLDERQVFATLYPQGSKLAAR